MKIVCETGETVFNYKEYLKTNHWIKKKLQFKKEYICECRICQTDTGLNVHHTSYKNIGDEKLTDLCYLCYKCHTWLHSSMSSIEINTYLAKGKGKKVPKNMVKKVIKKKVKKKPKKKIVKKIKRSACNS